MTTQSTALVLDLQYFVIDLRLKLHLHKPITSTPLPILPPPPSAPDPNVPLRLLDIILGATAISLRFPTFFPSSNFPLNLSHVEHSAPVISITHPRSHLLRDLRAQHLTILCGSYSYGPAHDSAALVVVDGFGMFISSIACGVFGDVCACISLRWGVFFSSIGSVK